MKITNETMNILKHAAQIAPGIKIDAGTDIFSAHESRSIRMHACLADDDAFPTSFAIMNLAQFLNTISLIEDPELKFEDDHVNISSNDGASSVKYYYSDPSTVNQDNKKLKGEVEYEFTFCVGKEDLSRVFKASAAIGADDICVYNNGGEIYMAAMDKRRQAGNRYDLLLMNSEGLEKSGKTFKIFFRKSNLKLTGNNFTVSVSSRGLSTWTADDANVPKLVFYIAIERDSEFN